MGVMAVLKGTPTTYNKDFQECWELMFDSVDALHDCIRIATGVLSTIKINPDRMMKVRGGGLLFAGTLLLSWCSNNAAFCPCTAYLLLSACRNRLVMLAYMQVSTCYASCGGSVLAINLAKYLL
jgi:hypothetical protein